MYDNNNTYYQPAPQPPQQPQQPRRDVASKILGIVSFVHGIIGLCLFWNYVIGLSYGITAIVTGIIARKRDNTNNRAKTGLTLGIIATAVSVVFIIAILVIFGVAFFSNVGDLDFDIFDGFPVVNV